MSFQRVDADKHPLTARATERIAAGLPEYIDRETTPELIHLGDVAIQLEISNGAIGVVGHDVAFPKEPIGRIQTAVIQRRIRVNEAQDKGRPAQKVRGDSRFFCTHAQVELINDHYCARARSNQEIADDLGIMSQHVTELVIANDIPPVQSLMPKNKGSKRAFYGLFNLDQIAEIKSHEEEIEAFRAGTTPRRDVDIPEGLHSERTVCAILGITHEVLVNILAGEDITPERYPGELGKDDIYIDGKSYRIVAAEQRRRRSRRQNEFHHHDELANRYEIG